MVAVTKSRNVDGTTILSASGRVDSASARDFERTLSSAMEGEGVGDVILDLGRISYISSAGLRVLLMAAKIQQKRNARLALCTLPDSVRQVLEVSGFTRLIPVHETRAEAISAFAVAAS